MKTAAHRIMSHHDWQIASSACVQIYRELEQAYEEVFPFADAYLRLKFNYVRGHIVSGFLLIDYADFDADDYVFWGVNERELANVREDLLREMSVEERASAKRSWARGYGISERETETCRPLVVLPSNEAQFLGRGWSLAFEDEKFVLFRTALDEQKNVGKHPVRFILPVTS